MALGEGAIRPQGPFPQTLETRTPNPSSPLLCCREGSRFTRGSDHPGTNVVTVKQVEATALPAWYPPAGTELQKGLAS